MYVIIVLLVSVGLVYLKFDYIKEIACTKATTAPVVTTAAPVVTTAAPVVTTAAPVVTTAAPVVTTAAPVIENFRAHASAQFKPYYR
jgi:hypothetical protein